MFSYQLHCCWLDVGWCPPLEGGWWVMTMEPGTYIQQQHNISWGTWGVGHILGRKMWLRRCLCFLPRCWGRRTDKTVSPNIAQNYPKYIPLKFQSHPWHIPCICPISPGGFWSGNGVRHPEVLPRCSLLNQPQCARFVGTTRNNSTLGPWPGTDSFLGSRSLHVVEKISAEKISAGMFSMTFAKTMPHKNNKLLRNYVPKKCKFYIFRYTCPHDLEKRSLHWSSFFPQPGLPVGGISLRKQQDWIQEPECTKASYASMPRFNNTQNQTWC